jgi:hypothetical protein
MIDPSSTGLIHQEKILDSIASLKLEIDDLKLLLERDTGKGERIQQIAESLSNLSEKTILLKTDSDYFFELCNSKHMMMMNHIEYIKRLELKLAELRP